MTLYLQTQDWKRGRLFYPRESEISFRIQHVELPIGRFRGDHPRRLVSTASHDATDEDGDEVYRDIVRGEDGTLREEIGEGKVGVK